MAAAQQAMAELQQQMQQVMVSRHQAFEELADDLAPIALAIAEQIVRAEIACDEELILHLVRDTLQKLDRRTTKSVIIKLHKDDVPPVQEHLAQNPLYELKAELIILDDITVERGGCLVETHSGLIDATLKTRIEMVCSLLGIVEWDPDKPQQSPHRS